MQEGMSNDSVPDQTLLVESLLTPPYIPIYVGVLNGVIFLTGLFGNFLVMLVVCRVREMRTSTNYFLISLSAADSLVLLVCQPSAILEFYAEERWLLGRVLCKIVPFLENAVAYTSILTLLVISIERFVAVCHPLAVHMTFTKKKTTQAVGVVWLVAFCLSIPFMILTDEEQATFYDGSQVSVCKTRVHEAWHHVYLIFTFVGLFVVPLLVLCVLYTFIITTLRRDSMEVGRRNEKRDRRQVIAILITVILLFFACLLPVRAITIWKVYTSTANIEALQLEGYLNLMWFARIMMYINSAGNPVIYNMVSTKFRKAFRTCLKLGSRERGSFSILGSQFSQRSSFTQMTENYENVVCETGLRKGQAVAGESGILKTTSMDEPALNI